MGERVVGGGSMDEGKGWKTSKRPSDTFYGAEGGFVISGGNFHG